MVFGLTRLLDGDRPSWSRAGPRQADAPPMLAGHPDADLEEPRGRSARSACSATRSCAAGGRGRRLRQGAAHGWSPTSPTPCSTLPVPASRRRRSESGCGSSPGTSRARSATWSTRSSSCPRRSRTASRAASPCRSWPTSASGRCRSSRAASTCYGEPVTIDGSELLARAIQHETDHLDGILFIDKLDTDARKAAMKEIRESEWFGARAADRPGLARTPPAGWRSDAGRLRRHPRGRPARPRRRRRVRPRPGRRGHPPGRPGRAAGGSWSRARWPSGPRSSAYPCSSPTTRATPAFQEELRALAARLLPGRRLRRPAAAVGPRHPRRTAGSTCTSRCCPPGVGRRRSSTRSGPATRSPGRRRSGSSRSSTPARRSA